MKKDWVAALALGALIVGFAGRAAAQAQITGTYITYLSMGADGSLICTSPPCTSGQSIEYVETTGGTPSCDFFYPGSPQESFTVEVTPSGGAMQRFTNSGATTADDLTTLSGPTASGRTISWSGRATSSDVDVRVEQTYEYGANDRHIRVAVTLTNDGSSTLDDVYYLRNHDPDHGSCSIGSTTATTNDVQRQPPTDGAALVTTGAGTTTMVFLGIGAHDPRARVHTGGFANTDASGEWTTPMDSAGASRDEGVDIVFREPSLAPGASVTFEWFYVFGPDVATVEMRFDELGFPTAPCVGLSDGDACTTSDGDTGVCRDSRCCYGCWDGSRCRTGSSASNCGLGGVACASCADGDACTSDVCTAGACSNPDAPAGTSCDDGLFCTAVDECDGSGGCVGSGDACDDSESCTTDTCDESTDSCSYVGHADGTSCAGGGGAPGTCHDAACCTGCWDSAGTGFCRTGTGASLCGAGGVACVSCIDGDDCTSDICSGGVCSNPFAPAGARCDDGLFCTATDTCDGAGTCTGSGVRCDDGQSCTTDTCDESADRCEFTPSSGCIIGGVCVATGATNPSYPCQVCDPASDDSDWTPLAAGTSCGSATCVGGRVTMRECDAAGFCETLPPVDCPTGTCMDASSCGPGCTAGDCADGEWCNPTTARCEALGDAGDACDVSMACASAHCVDGVCCDSGCDGLCERCDAPSAAGTCTPIAAGADPDDECDTACDGAGACEPMIDAGAPDEDAGPPDEDAGTPPSDDAAISLDGGPGTPDAGTGEEDAGCGCSAPGTSHRSAPLLLLLLLGLAVLPRRRR